MHPSYLSELIFLYRYQMLMRTFDSRSVNDLLLRDVGLGVVLPERTFRANLTIVDRNPSQMKYLRELLHIFGQLNSITFGQH